MIVDPDFFDHWKTLLLVESLEGDPASPLYVLRLWAHCQNRRKCEFDSLSDRALKALCRYPGHPKKLVTALVESGFVTVSDCGRLCVIGWDQYNAKLLANWENGKKGGRPKKPTKAQQEPTENPTGTHEEPIRVDKSRGDKKLTHTHPAEDFDPHDEWAGEWATWLGTWEARMGKRFDASVAQYQASSLHAKDPAKAKRDLIFSLDKMAKNILDSDNDFSKSRKGNSGGGSAKRKLKI